MKYLPFLLVAVLGCGQPATLPPPVAAPIVVRQTPTDFDSLLRSGVDTVKARSRYAYEVAAYITRSYGYDVYGEAALAYVDRPDNIRPVLILYCDWFSASNAVPVFDEIRSRCRPLGFHRVTFYRRYGTASVAGFNVD